MCDIKRGFFICRCYLEYNLFKLSLDLNYVNTHLDFASNMNDDVSISWHNCLCHVNYSKLQSVSKCDLIPHVNHDKCRTCMLTKVIRAPFHSVERSSTLLELT